jgi:hypothetical protein
MTKSLQKIKFLALTLGAVLTAATAQADVFEVVSAPIADGVTVDQMRAADAPVGAFVAALPGFISRENGVSVQEDGISPGNEWFVIVRWDTIEHAQEAARLLNASPDVAAQMFQSMKADQLFFRHYTVQD